MTYNEFVELIKEVANEVNADGIFFHGRNFDLTLEFNKVFPQIHLYPFIQSDNADNDHIAVTQATVGFWKMDGHEQSLEERQEIISDMDILCTNFITELKTKKGFQIISTRREPQYLMYMGVLSGIALQLNINSLRTC